MMKNENMFVDSSYKVELGAMAVGVSATKWSESFELPRIHNASFSVVVQGTGTTIDTAFYLEVGDVALTTAEENLTNANYAIPDDMATAIFTIEDALLHRKTITPTVGKFARIKAIGSGTNTADVSFATVNICIVIS